MCLTSKNTGKGVTYTPTLNWPTGIFMNMVSVNPQMAEGP